MPDSPHISVYDRKLLEIDQLQVVDALGRLKNGYGDLYRNPAMRQQGRDGFAHLIAALEGVSEEKVRGEIAALERAKPAEVASILKARAEKKIGELSKKPVTPELKGEMNALVDALGKGGPSLFRRTRELSDAYAKSGSPDGRLSAIEGFHLSALALREAAQQADARTPISGRYDSDAKDAFLTIDAQGGSFEFTGTRDGDGYALTSVYSTSLSRNVTLTSPLKVDMPGLDKKPVPAETLETLLALEGISCNVTFPIPLFVAPRGTRDLLTKQKAGLVLLYDLPDKAAYRRVVASAGLKADGEFKDLPTPDALLDKGVEQALYTEVHIVQKEEGKKKFAAEIRADLDTITDEAKLRDIMLTTLAAERVHDKVNKAPGLNYHFATEIAQQRKIVEADYADEVLSAEQMKNLTVAKLTGIYDPLSTSENQRFLLFSFPGPVDQIKSAVPKPAQPVAPAVPGVGPQAGSVFERRALELDRQQTSMALSNLLNAYRKLYESSDPALREQGRNAYVKLIAGLEGTDEKEVRKQVEELEQKNPGKPYEVSKVLEARINGNRDLVALGGPEWRKDAPISRETLDKLITTLRMTAPPLYQDIDKLVGEHESAGAFPVRLNNADRLNLSASALDQVKSGDVAATYDKRVLTVTVDRKNYVYGCESLGGDRYRLTSASSTDGKGTTFKPPIDVDLPGLQTVPMPLETQMKLRALNGLSSQMVDNYQNFRMPILQRQELTAARADLEFLYSQPDQTAYRYVVAWAAVRSTQKTPPTAEEVRDYMRETAGVPFENLPKPDALLDTAIDSDVAHMQVKAIKGKGEREKFAAELRGDLAKIEDDAKLRDIMLTSLAAKRVHEKLGSVAKDVDYGKEIAEQRKIVEEQYKGQTLTRDQMRAQTVETLSRLYEPNPETILDRHANNLVQRWPADSGSKVNYQGGPNEKIAAALPKAQPPVPPAAPSLLELDRQETVRSVNTFVNTYESLYSSDANGRKQGREAFVRLIAKLDNISEAEAQKQVEALEKEKNGDAAAVARALKLRVLEHPKVAALGDTLNPPAKAVSQEQLNEVRGIFRDTAPPVYKEIEALAAGYRTKELPQPLDETERMALSSSTLNDVMGGRRGAVSAVYDKDSKQLVVRRAGGTDITYACERLDGDRYKLTGVYMSGSGRRQPNVTFAQPIEVNLPGLDKGDLSPETQNKLRALHGFGASVVTYQDKFVFMVNERAALKPKPQPGAVPDPQPMQPVPPVNTNPKVDPQPQPQAQPRGLGPDPVPVQPQQQKLAVGPGGPVPAGMEPVPRVPPQNNAPAAVVQPVVNKPPVTPKPETKPETKPVVRRGPSQRPAASSLPDEEKTSGSWMATLLGGGLLAAAGFYFGGATLGIVGLLIGALAGGAIAGTGPLFGKGGLFNSHKPVEEPFLPTIGVDGKPINYSLDPATGKPVRVSSNDAQADDKLRTALEQYRAQPGDAPRGDPSTLPNLTAAQARDVPSLPL